MENLTKDIISVLQYLLPGFLAAWVFYGFTSFPKQSEFERLVQALIFTLIIQSIVFIEKMAILKAGTCISLGQWNEHSEILCSSITGVLLGVIFAYFANNDKLHKICRDIGLTKESSYPSEWFGEFNKNITYVVLHLEGERRLYGWPREWPSEPDKGHFVLELASWLGENNEDIPLQGVSSIMVRAKDVVKVEFMEKTWEKKNG